MAKENQKRPEEKYYLYKDGQKAFASSIELAETLKVTSLIMLYYSKYSPRFRFNGEEHNFCELYYVANGRMKVEAEGFKGLLSAGDFILVPSMVWHTMNPDNCYATGISVAFYGENMPSSILSGACSLSEKQLLQTFLNTFLKNYKPSDPKGEIFARSTQKSYACDQMLKCLLESFLISVTDNQLQMESKTTAPKSDDLTAESGHKLAVSIKQYLEAHVDENISLGELAENMGYSVTHLCRIFKTYFGDSVKNHLTKLKIEKAMQKIELGQESLTKISDSLGFDGISYFSKTFKKVTGISPSEYRNFSVYAHLLDTKALGEDD